MMKTLSEKIARFGLALSLSVASATLVAGPVSAAEEAAHETPHYPIVHPTQEPWSFAGVFGRFDTAQLQRGYQVYKEVCAACH
ncbi:MAG: cytochrome c1, partial [Rhizobiales bacterium]|nr:cytochrome c1 [Hyphomicrobiales bacterium]